MSSESAEVPKETNSFESKDDDVVDFFWDIDRFSVLLWVSVSSQFRSDNDSLSSIGNALSLRNLVFFLAIRLIYFAALFIVAS